MQTTRLFPAWRDARVLLAGLLAIATVAIGQPGLRTVPLADPLAPNVDWQAVGQSSLIEEGNGSVRLSGLTERGARALQDVTLPEVMQNGWRIRLTAARTEGGGVSLPSATVARFAVAFLENGERIGWASSVRIAAWPSEQTVDISVDLPAGTDALRLIFTARSPGEWRLSVPRVQAVANAPWRLPVLLGLVVGWATLLALLLRPALAHPDRWRVVPVLIGLAVVVLGTGFSRGMLGAVLAPIASMLDGLLSGSAGSRSLLLQKGGHFIAFATLAMALAWCRGPFALSPTSLVCLCASVALASEALQLQIVGRSSSGVDLAIDAAGIAIGLGVFLLVRRVLGMRTVDDADRQQLVEDRQAADSPSRGTATG